MNNIERANGRQPHPQPLPRRGGGLHGSRACPTDRHPIAVGQPPFPLGKGLGVGLTTLLFILWSALLLAQASHSQLRAGEQHYDDKNFPKAETAYGEASGDPVAQYNAGNAAFQQGKYDIAADWFRKAAAAPSAIRADAFYNLGNALMLLGKYREAVDAYERSLRLRPNQPDAKKNLQIARNKLREQQDPPPPPPPAQKPPPPPPPRNDYVDQAKQPPKKEVPTGMSAGEARQLLDGTIEQEETKNARQYRALPPEANPGRAKKDW